MGQRRYGFLTEWQWSYIHNAVPPMSKTRQRTEDYYIIKSLEKTFEQLKYTRFWLMHKQNQKLYFDELTVTVVQREFEALRGKRSGKIHKYRLKDIKCPMCGERFNSKVALSDKKILFQISTIGLSKKDPPEVERKEEKKE